MERIFQQHWIEYPKDIREHLAKVFNLQRTGISEIRDNTVVSDGYTNDDLRGITQQKMIDYVGSDGDFNHLWKVSISKAKFELHPPLFEIKSNVSIAEVPIQIPERIIDSPNAIKPFCSQCDSKGVKHKKICPTLISNQNIINE